MRRISYLLLAALACYAQDRRVQPIIPRKQVALVIGNAAYPNRPLANPVHDAQAVAQRLRELNYDVTVATDAGRKAMAQAIDQFVNKLGTGDVAFFYYSGHGMQVDGENYLIPVDFQGRDETDVRYDTHALGRIQERMERSGAQLNILVLDACRDNPFRSTVRGGLSGLAAPNAGRGTFIALATSPGRTASDNPDGRYGLFTQYLLDALSVKGAGLDDVFNLVRERVDTASGGKQLPWTLSSVVGRYSFVAGEPAAAPVAAATVSTSGSSPRPGDVKVNPKDGQRYVWIPPGSFIMGCSLGDTECFDDEKPSHRVTLTKGFWMGQTPVTIGAYRQYSQQTGKPMPSDGDIGGRKLNAAAGDDSFPVVLVGWDESKAYCEWIGGRLPTEEEWEYAARSGTQGARYGNLDNIAWYGANSGGRPHPVGQKQPNAWNLYDMLGNVSPWTLDRYDDPSPALDMHVLRGGDWSDEARWIRASLRFGAFGSIPKFTQSGWGFRCVEQ